jgi:hypothetical protein
LGSPYDALVYDVILPTQPRWHKGSILLAAARLVNRGPAHWCALVGFDSDEVLSWWFFDPKGAL